ncbi:hypothetical protein IE81DRAFT_321577 [Ceraceosorus guamensis]|uniref:Homeobox domain-containing protein n=1 Tax=Ceraceosorus guamensis TaxID=1522189 RepID=A0A316W3R7_9BASI|nr:hypothetical protein IE81DRAFT_321577 [Ceraceosorus guamensis]PWN44174.1 hypothetical protein IE81DRAFT_321577 [Ceraceosorus guamensis]
MLGLDGDHTLTKRKQTVIANALGRTDKAVEHWWNTRTKKKVAETVARFAGKWSNFH